MIICASLVAGINHEIIYFEPGDSLEVEYLNAGGKSIVLEPIFGKTDLNGKFHSSYFSLF